VELPKAQLGVNVVTAKTRRVTGVDIYVESELEPTPLATSLDKLASTSSLRLEMITNRGAMVFPSSGRRVSLVDHFRCRFVPRNSGSELSDADILALLAAVGNQYRWMHIEKLQEFDGQPAFSKSQI
jgi:isocitrate dehydrogenase